MVKVALDSIGCKLNQAEMQKFARQLADTGYELVAPHDVADIYILNTCTVTHVADRKCRNWLRNVRTRNPGAFVVAIGCYSERAGDELSRIEGVNLILGNEKKSNLLQILSDSGYSSTGIKEKTAVLRTRALVKVQDGCNNFCSYCIVPLVRGREKSLPVDLVIGEVKQRVADGCKEVVITGTEIGSYHHNEFDLKRLLERILAETGVTRLRLSSLQPREITSEFISLWRDERLCRHFHLSLQSGSDAVLKRMKRHYTTKEYEQAVALIRKSLPEAAITTDIIVGFPGETDEEFRESYEFCKRMKFARVHVFAYSPRPGTEAAKMRPRVPDKVKKQRSQQMLALAEESSADFRKRFAGKKMLVLWEQQTGGLWSGLTDNYIRVYQKSDKDLINRIEKAMVGTPDGSLK